MRAAWGNASRAGLVGLALLGEAGVARADAPVAPSAPAAPPPLTMTVAPSATAGAPWKVRVENTGDVPVRIAADVRLLSFELVPKAAADAPRSAKAPKPVRCALPAGARPRTDEGHELVVPGKRAWSTSFDPLYFCFDGPARAALVAGTEVRARFGFAPERGRSTLAPFVAAPVGAAVGAVAPAKELVAAPFVMGEPSAEPSATPPPPPAPFRVSATKAVDVATGKDISLTVTVENRSDRSLVAFVRPSTFRFRVEGPRGPVACGVPAAPPAIRELFSTIAPKRSVAHAVRLLAYCPSDTFDEAGIYRVRAILDTSNASGASIGLKTWEDVAEAETDALVRVRQPRRESGPKPALE